MLTLVQKQALKANILATPEALAIFENGDLGALAEFYNASASPDFWAWRTRVTRAELYTQQNDLPIQGAQTGFWEWDTYKAQTVTEQGAWREMFMGDEADFSKLNIRNGVAKIFAGTGAPAAQREHVLAIARRKATRIERLFVVTNPQATGTTALPAFFGYEGPVQPSDLQDLVNI